IVRPVEPVPLEAVGDDGEAAVELAARHAAGIGLAGEKPPLQAAGEPVAPIGPFEIDGDALAGRIFQPPAAVAAIERQVAALLPPQRPFGRPEIAAVAGGELLDRLRLVDDRIERRIELLNALRLRPRALHSAYERNTTGGELQHTTARDSSVGMHVVLP